MFCKQCGNQLNEGARFCNQCGNLIENTVIPDAQKHNILKAFKEIKGIKKSWIPGIIVCCILFLGGILIALPVISYNRNVYNIHEILPAFYSHYGNPVGSGCDFYTWDKKGNTYQAIHGITVNRIKYDSKGKVTEWEAPEDEYVYKCEYGSKGRLERVVRYDVFGNVENRWEFQFDKAHQLVKMVECDKNGVVHNAGGVQEFVYDAKEKLWRYKGFWGIVRKEVEIDHQGRMLKYVEYDTLCKVEEWSQYQYEYDKKGKLLEVTEYNPYGATICTEYTYNNKDQLIEYERTYAKSDTVETTEYEYDKSGKVVRTVTKAEEGKEYKFEVEHSYEYDKSGKVVKAEKKEKEGELISYREFEYDRDGNVSKEEQCTAFEDGNSIRNIEWDTQGRLKKEVYESPWDRGDSEYEYDEHGNQIKVVSEKEYGIGANWHTKNIVESETEYEYDNYGNMVKSKTEEYRKNIYAERDPDIFEYEWEYKYKYEYDDKGNILSKTEYRDDEKLAKYEYDPQGRLIKYRSDGSKYECEYDYQGNRIKEENTYSEFEYHYGIDGRISTIKEERRMNDETVLYLSSMYYGYNDADLSQVRVNNQDGENLYHQQWNLDGNLSETCDYHDAKYGMLITSYEYDSDGYPIKMIQYDEYKERIVEEK